MKEAISDVVFFFKSKHSGYLQDRFTQVHDGNFWGDDETRSGPGSRKSSGSVHAALAALQHVKSAYGFDSVIDIPCGDFNWLDQFLDMHPDVAYTGYDIVERLIEDNRKRHPGRVFHHLNIASSVPPRADLSFCKDLLNHLTYADVRRTIANMKASGSTYLLTSNNFNDRPNVDLKNIGGSSRHLDLVQAPFSFPKPLWNTHYMGLWKIDQLPSKWNAW